MLERKWMAIGTGKGLSGTSKVKPSKPRIVVGLKRVSKATWNFYNH
jgi:hypothetical protein